MENAQHREKRPILFLSPKYWYFLVCKCTVKGRNVQSQV